MKQSRSKPQYIALHWLLVVNKEKLTLDEIDILEGLQADLLHKIDAELKEGTDYDK